MSGYRRQNKGWIYNDCFISPEVEIDAPESEYLGDPSRLAPKRYSWGAVKLPKGQTWNKDAQHFKDSEYVFSKISVYDNNPDLFIRFTPSRGRNGFLQYSHKHKRTIWYTYKQRPLYLTIRDYASLRALQVLNDIGTNDNGDDLGRHFRRAILTFWSEHELPF